MQKRGYNPNPELSWKALEKRHEVTEINYIFGEAFILLNDKIHTIYSEHNDEYYKECIENLKKKGIDIE